MSESPLYFVQTAETPDRSRGDGGWHTAAVFLERATAEQMASARERSSLWVDGEDVSANTVTIARVVSDADLRAEGDEDALYRAVAETRVQLQSRWRESGHDLPALRSRLIEAGVDPAILEG